MLYFIQGKKGLPPFPGISAKAKQKIIIIENRDNKIIHERKEETVKSSIFGFMCEKNREKYNAKRPFSAPMIRLLYGSKLICKLSQKRQTLALGSRSK